MGLLSFKNGKSSDSGEKGFVKLEDCTDDATIVLSSWYSNSDRVATKGSEPAPVKPGVYEMVDLRFFRKGQDGETWSSRCILPEGISITAGDTCNLKGVSGPKKARILAKNLGTDYYSFSLLIEDLAQNRYSYIRKNNHPIENPGFIIEDSEGNEVSRGIFYPG